ncbi:DUF4810 domain-containing protein [Catenovulum sp. SX2]|uniref:DUF4810 domain-containing protein n=1 Tax=Catenovulum sp. SX2 TaxID=3398614 RepID=UPI003F849949
MLVNKTQVKNTLLAFVALLSVGCATKDNRQYYWGNYETIIYGHHLKQEDFPAQVQIQQLTKDIEKAQTIGKPVAPGVYAHLGMLYANIGDRDLALAALTKEKELYPDSTLLIDGLVTRLKQHTQQTQ